MSKNLNHSYSEKEERLNVLSHGFGLILSVIAFPFLILKSLRYSTFCEIISFYIFGISLIILYAASTFYHASKNPSIRRKLNILDHAAIYILIAGTYSPFCLIALPQETGWFLFGFIWLFALTGVILKLFFTGKFDKISTGLYLIMGWLVVFYAKSLIENLTTFSLLFIALGGLFYTVGAIFYSFEKIKYNHAIFHFFVLLGSTSHFIAVWLL